MKAVLLGNGIEIEFQENLGKEKIIKNALEAFIVNPKNGIKVKSLFPTAMLHFAKMEKLSVSNITDRDWKNIFSYLTNEKKNKSIEDFYIDIERSVLNKKGKNEFENLFIKYIEYFSNKIETKQFEKKEDVIKIENDNYKVITRSVNILEEKFSSYDLILTTNYTDFLSRNLKEQENKIVYLHGKINDLKNPPLIGLEKTGNKEITFEKVMTNLNNALKTLDNQNIDENKLVLDIYGWSFDNEEDLIKLIVHSIMNFILKNNYIFYGSKKEWNEIYWKFNFFASGINVILQSEIEKKNLEINYYFYSEEDLLKANKYIENSKWLKEKGLELIETHDWRDGIRLFKVNNEEASTGIWSKFNDFKVATLEHKNFEITKSAIEEKKKEGKKYY